VKWRKYSPELKYQAVQEYLAGTHSQAEICMKYDISTRKLLRNWITRYNSHKDFKQPNHGGPIYMTKGRTTTLEERIEIVSHCIANNKDYGKTIERYGVSYQQIYYTGSLVKTTNLKSTSTRQSNLRQKPS
jgi:transposase-like protein